MLNTDLHISTDPKKMTRQGFVKNIFDCIREDVKCGTNSTPDLIADDGSSSQRGSDGAPDDARPYIPSRLGRARSGSLISSFREKANGSTSNLFASQLSQGSTSSVVVVHAPEMDGQDPSSGGASSNGHEGSSSSSIRPKSNRFGSSSTSLPPAVHTKAWEVEIEALLKVCWRLRLMFATSNLSRIVHNFVHINHADMTCSRCILSHFYRTCTHRSRTTLSSTQVSPRVRVVPHLHPLDPPSVLHRPNRALCRGASRSERTVRQRSTRSSGAASAVLCLGGREREARSVLIPTRSDERRVLRRAMRPQ